MKTIYYYQTFVGLDKLMTHLDDIDVPAFREIDPFLDIPKVFMGSDVYWLVIGTGTINRLRKPGLIGKRITGEQPHTRIS